MEKDQTPVEALFAEFHTREDRQAAGRDLDAMLALCTLEERPWFALSRSAIHHANDLLIADPDTDLARGWCAFVAAVPRLDAAVEAVLAAERVIEDVPRDGYDYE